MERRAGPLQRWLEARLDVAGAVVAATPWQAWPTAAPDRELFRW